MAAIFLNNLSAHNSGTYSSLQFIATPEEENVELS